ncbi:MAG: phosphate ABC transporter substrate-binding protein PstS [Mesorhizobium sp.]|nr:MAG: phosphate ABC transporter substrate-binding protein PstS [Mesorhizobium sp.]TIL49372.1 MAG: phosphate ABC transporter substrate-binding protein PstS [Mesorhizobium sp.]
MFPASFASLRRKSAKIGGAVTLAVGLMIGAAAQAEPIRGAGSTLAAPIIGQWATAYENARADGGDYVSPDWKVDYEIVGSLAGVLRLDQPDIDFAATDAPINGAELKKAGRQQFPIVMGAIAVLVNLDGIGPGSLRLTGPLQSWSDPAIKAVNPDLTLPDLRISVVHRKDGSGSTFVFTEYLSAVSGEWKAKYGANTLISWPLGTDAEGTQNLIQAVHDTKGAIAYAESGQAQRANLVYALIENKSGKFVKPGPEGVQAAATSIDWAQTTDFFASLTDRDGDAAYPISTAVFAVVQVSGRSEHRYRRVHDLFRLAFAHGADDAAALGYVPLPTALVARIEQEPVAN